MPADRAGRELKLLEVVATMDRHLVVDVLRILFWSLTDAQLTALGTLLLRRRPAPARLAELRAVVVSPGDGVRDR